MLRLRVSVDERRAQALSDELQGKWGVRRLIKLPEEGRPDIQVIEADVASALADEVCGALEEFGISAEDFLLVRQEAIAPITSHAARTEAGNVFAWVELLGEARANSRPIGRYLVLMAVSGLIAGMGVLEDNAILIVGAMAVSPDLLPICATCVGVAANRVALAWRAFVTLTVGLLLASIVAAAATLALDLTGFIPGDYAVGDSGLGALAEVDYSTVLVAAAAGVAAILAFETRASAAVGVAISVTTIPASAYLGVAFGAGEPTEGVGALLVLGINVALMITFGTLTLLFQKRLDR